MATYNYIVAKATTNDGSPLAITAYANGEVHVKVLNYGDETQMWEKKNCTSRTDNQHQPYGLINKKFNKCLGRDGNHQGNNLSLKDMDAYNMDELSMWRDEANWGGINSYADWEQKINIPGNGPYNDGQRLVTWEYGGAAPNESWYTVSEDAKMELLSLDFTVDQLKLLTLPPELFHSHIVENDTPIDQNGVSVSYTTSVVESKSFTEETGVKISVSTSLKFTIPDVGLGGKVTYKQSSEFTFSTNKTSSTSKDMTITFAAPVAAHSKVKMTGLVHKGQINVPYKAVIKYTYPNGHTATKNLAGQYTNVTAYNIETVTENI